MLNRFVSVCRDLFVTFGWYVVVAFAVVLAVGIYACATNNVGLMVVTALAIVGLAIFAERGDHELTRAEREALAIDEARKAADRIALERARDLLLREPIMRTVHAQIDGTEL